MNQDTVPDAYKLPSFMASAIFRGSTVIDLSQITGLCKGVKAVEDKRELIRKILKIEWDAFTNVMNIGGKAGCQEDPATFKIMRVSQFVSWSDATLKNYLDDLLEAKANGRNLLSEKYGRMMESNFPSEYDQIKHLLPDLDPEVTLLIDKIIEIELAWQEDVQKRFPSVTGRGRPLYSHQDNQFATSFETYLRGELATYSKRTLELYYENRINQNSQNINGAEMTLEYTVKQYGFQSLKAANERNGLGSPAQG